MTGPIKVDESPYKVSNKIEKISQSDLNEINKKQEKRLNHAHNLLLKVCISFDILN